MATTHPELSWDDVPLDSLAQLCGTSSENAPLVASALFSKHPQFDTINIRERTSQPPTHASPWYAASTRYSGSILYQCREEYDLEEECLRTGSTVRLGCETQYFGGKVDQIVRLTVDRCASPTMLYSLGPYASYYRSGKFNFRLQPPAKAKSFRFRRYLGSRRLLEVRFAENEPHLRPHKLREYFINNALVINGRVFRAFYARKTAVHLVETNEDFYRPDDALMGDHYRKSLREFIEWHNPLYANPGQVCHISAVPNH
jgi:RNA-dependent RNA polymerase